MKNIATLCRNLIAGSLLAATVSCGSSMGDKRSGYFNLSIYGNDRNLFFQAEDGTCEVQCYSLTKECSSTKELSLIDDGCNGSVDHLAADGLIWNRTEETERRSDYPETLYARFKYADDLYTDYITEIESATGVDLGQIVNNN